MNIKLLVSGLIVFFVVLSTVIFYYENKLIPMEKQDKDAIKLKKELLLYIENQKITTNDSLIFTDRFGNIWKNGKITSSVRAGIYFDNNQCNTCVVDAMDYFKTNIEHLKINTPFILTDARYMSIRELKIMENEYDYPVFSVRASQYPDLESIIKNQKPFFFLMDSLNTISAIYMPEDTLNSIIGKEYFGLIKEKIERNNRR